MTFLGLRAAKLAITKFAVIVVVFTTEIPVTDTPPPLTATEDPDVKLAPVKVTATVAPRAWALGVTELSVGRGGLLTVNVTELVWMPPVVTVTLLPPVAAVFAMAEVAVIVVALCTVTLLMVMPLPETFTVDPRVEKFVPVSVTLTVVPRKPPFGETAVRVGGATEVPVSDTGEPVMGALAVSATVAFTVPVAPGAWNWTKIVQLAAAASVVAQVPPDRVNGAPTGANATLRPVSGAAPAGLVIVRVCAGLVVFCTTLPKFTASGAT